jgi:hypothetical protein
VGGPTNSMQYRVNPKFARSLPLFSLWRLTQAHARPTAVFVDEFDAGQLKCPSKHGPSRIRSDPNQNSTW